MPPAATCLTLEEGLDHFAGDAYAGVELDVDMKLPGYESEVAAGLAERGLAERSLVSTMYVESLDRLGELAPRAPARLVGAARPARLHALGARAARLLRRAGLAGAPAGPGARRASARADARP